MRLYIILALLLILPVAIAVDDALIETTFDPMPSFDWLANNTKISSDILVRDSALGLLALNNQDYDITSTLNEFVASQKSDGCWPRTGCTVIDTSFGLLVLQKTGQDTNQTITWLNDNEAAAGSVANGKWYIQIVTTLNGTCDVSCDSKTTKIDILKWTDINALGCGNIGTKKSQNYYVDCSDVGDPALHITLLYQIEKPEYSETFLLQDEQVIQKDVSVDNACFPKTTGGSTCDLESTLYATWILNSIGEEVHTIPYLESKLTEISGDPLKLSLLYLITNSKAYGDLLTAKQRPSGSWNDDIYKTSIGVLATLQSTENSQSSINATNWLQLKRNKKDYSWNEKIGDTAAALIAIHGSIDENIIPLSMETATAIEICDNGIDDNDNALIDCDDSDCANDVSCLCDLTKDECASDSDCASEGTGYTCDPVSCMCISVGCSLANGDQCEFDTDCASGEVCSSGCFCEVQEPTTPSMETDCTDKIDDDSDGDVDCADSDCKNDSACKKSSLWLWILLIILLIGGGFFVFYYFSYIKKGKGFSDFKNDINLLFAKKKTKKTTFEEHVAARETRTAQPAQRQVQEKPIYTQRPLKQGNVDNELEKSLEEARKLLGGK